MAEVEHREAMVFGEVAAEYNAGRPGYPAEALDFVFDHAGLRPESSALEVGPGTGQLSRSLVERVEDLTLVEPADGMRAVLQGRIPDARILDGSAESLPVADGTVHAVFAAQAFHWFDHRAALREFHRVLLTQGAVALLWNVRDDAQPVDRAVSNIVRPLRGAVPSYSGVDWKTTIAAAGPFRDVTSASFPHTQRLDAGAFADRFASVSWVASLPEPIRSSVSRDLSEVFDTHERDGGLSLSYRTEVYVTRRD